MKPVNTSCYMYAFSYNQPIKAIKRRGNNMGNKNDDLTLERICDETH
jgi:hypothetical protein